MLPGTLICYFNLYPGNSTIYEVYDSTTVAQLKLLFRSVYTGSAILIRIIDMIYMSI